MLLALYDHGIVPDVLVGTSVGALNAGFVAARPQSAFTARALAKVWRELRRNDVFPIRPWGLAGGLLSRSNHLVAPGALRRLLTSHIRFKDLADAPIPLHVVAYDLDCGQEVLLSSGPAITALEASAAVPGILPPVHFAERRLVDGGVVNNTPISHAVALGAERIYVLATRTFEARPLPARRSALAAGIDGLSIAIAGRIEADLDRYGGDAEIVLLPAPNPLDVQPIDFSHPDRLIADATAAARRRLVEVAGDVRRLRRAG